MAAERWWKCPRRLAVYADAELTVMRSIHSQSCPLVARADGAVSHGMCRCSSARFFLAENTPILTLSVQGDAQLCRAIDSGPFWIESGVPQRRCKAPVAPPTDMFSPKPLPKDVLAVQMARTEGRLKRKRRRRAIRGAEICILRDDPDEHLWRFIGTVCEGERHRALLIDAEVHADRGLAPAPHERIVVELERAGKPLKPRQVLYPVFPLPDGTEDPGWI